MLTYTYFSYFLVFCIICFSLKKYFPEKISYFLSIAAGITIYSLFSVFKLELIAILILLTLYFSKFKVSKHSILELLLSHNLFKFFTALFITLSYFAVFRFWDTAPPTSNQDTVWNAANVAHFIKFRPFLDQFSDFHILGNDFNYHFFGQFLNGSMARLLQQSAISATTIMNSIPLLFAALFLYKYLLKQFKLSQNQAAVLAFASFVCYGITSPFNANYDISVNTIGLYYFNTNLYITTAVFFTLLSTLSYIEVFKILRSQIINYCELLLIFIAFNLFILFTLSTKAPYAVVLIGTFGIHSFFYFMSNFKNKEFKHILPILFSFSALIIFSMVYYFYYLRISGDNLSLYFGQIIEISLTRLFNDWIAPKYIVYLATPVYLVLFMGAPFLVNIYSRFKSKTDFESRLFSDIGIISFFVGSFGLILLSQIGNSQLYFGVSAHFVGALIACLNLAKLIQKNCLTERIELFGLMFIALSFLGFFSLSTALLSVLAMFIFLIIYYKNLNIYLKIALSIILSGLLLIFAYRIDGFWAFLFTFEKHILIQSTLVLLSLVLAIYLFRKILKLLGYLLLIGISIFLFSIIKKNEPNTNEVYLRNACLWLKQNTPSNSVISINLHDDLAAGERRFFLCSAISERQFLIEGYDFISSSEKNLNLVKNNLYANEQIYINNNWEIIDYVIDVKGQIQNKSPIVEFTYIGDQKIRIFKK